MRAILLASATAATLRGRRSIRPASHRWHTYSADQLALMDSLGCERFHTIGASIGCSFSLKLSEIVPTRIASAVLQNPIGFSPQYPTVHPDKFAAWAKELMVKRPELDPTAVASLSDNLWSGDFVFSVDRDFVKRITVPILVMPGDDAPHPAPVGNELAETAPDAECLADWICPDFAKAQRDTVNAFLEKHTR